MASSEKKRRGFEQKKKITSENKTFPIKDYQRTRNKLYCALFEESEQCDEYTDKWRDRNRKELSSSLLVRRVALAKALMKWNVMEWNVTK